jgi:hypothetical protein
MGPLLSVAGYLRTDSAKKLLEKPWNETPPAGARLMFYHNGKVVQQSRNLRGLISRAHKIGVHAVSLFRTNLGTFGPGDVFVEYDDGSTVRVRFAEHGIAKAFFRRRYQRWGLNNEVRNSENYTVWF